MNVEQWPNHFRNRDEKSGGYAAFGGIHSVTGISLPGTGHRPHVHLAFRGGVSIDLDPVTAAELARRLPESLLALTTLPDVSGAATHLPEVS